MAISSKPTSEQRHVSLAENHDAIQCPLSDNFRFARDPLTDLDRISQADLAVVVC